MPVGGGGGLFSAFNSGHHRGDRTKAQNVRGGCLLEGPHAVATAVVKGLSPFFRCQCLTLRFSNQYLHGFINYPSTALMHNFLSDS